jgi:hypothetical protein
MSTGYLSIIFFVIGCFEYFIDQWERLVSVRLKILSTLWYSTLNNTIDFLMYIFLFGILIQFWENWHNGVHDYYKLTPYIFYTLGKILGTVGALYVYAEMKKARDREKALKLSAKQPKKIRGKRRTKKQKAADDKHNSDVAATMLDPVEVEDVKAEIKERAVEAATKQITEKINEAFNENN